MKGLIFTEFLEFVEQKNSYEIVDKIILKAQLEHGGAYTTLGTYDIQELLRLIQSYSAETNLSSKQILIEFGEYLFLKFNAYYPYLFKEKTTTFQFLNSVDNYIHIEVNKLYKGAELPQFECKIISPSKFIMIYSSSRPLADLAEGLIRGCIKYHHEDVDISREDFSPAKGYQTQFTLIRK